MTTVTKTFPNIIANPSNQTGTKLRHGTTTAVKIDHVTVGGGAPVVVQSMTNTDTANVQATTQQVTELAKAGSELVRITVNSAEAAAAVAECRHNLDAQGINVPLVGDFHFNGHKLLDQFPECAQALSKYRINPGNVGRGKKRDSQFARMIEIACEYNKPVRIGVNWGSLDQALMAKLMDENNNSKNPLDNFEIMDRAMIQSALDSAKFAESVGLAHDKIILSCKMSGVQDLIRVYRSLATQSDYPLHLGLTEAGMGSKGIVASTAALSILLQEGIGDTIRISLTPEPGGDRCTEVTVAQEILQSMGLRAFLPTVIACPGCGRTTSSYFQQLAKDIQSYIKTQMPSWKKQYAGVENMSIAVMGCVVNGPGESKLANIGISLPGTGEKPVAPIYVDGKKTVTLKGEHIADDFQKIVLNYIETHYR